MQTIIHKTVASNQLEQLADQARTLMANTHANGASWEASFRVLPDPLQAPYLIDTLMRQILNGGFQAWVDNAYAVRIRETYDAVRSVGTADSAAVATMLARLAPYVNTDENSFSYGWLGAWNRNRVIDRHDEIRLPVGLLKDSDHAYYALHGAWKAEVEEWVAKGMPDRSSQLPMMLYPAAAAQAARYPWIAVQLSGEDGNAFAILGRVQRAMREAGISAGEIQNFFSEATAGNYDRLLQTCVKWVNAK